MTVDLPELRAKIQVAAQQVQRHGIHAHIPTSERLFRAARKMWLADPHNTDLEYLWRAASLIHGAQMAGRNEWANAYITLNGPNLRGRKHPQPSSGSLAFAAFMEIGKGVALRQLDRGAPQLGAIAHGYLAQLVDPRYDRWRGVAALLEAEEASSRREWQPSLEPELRRLDAHTQPEARALAEYLIDLNNGRLRPKRGGYCAHECLYFFN